MNERGSRGDRRGIGKGTGMGGNDVHIVLIYENLEK